VTQTRIVMVRSAGQIEKVRELFEEYRNSFGFTPCFQNFAGELAVLPGDYAPTTGRRVLP